MKNIILIIFISILLAACDFSTEKKKYVIMISFDGFRFDYPDSVMTPALSQLEKDGVRAEGLRPVFPSKTFPNHYSIATGLYSENTGIVANVFYDPGLDEWYRIGDTTTVRDAKWYGGEPIWVTAEKNGIKAASYFWVGTEAPIKGIPLSYFYYYKHNTPHDTIINQAIEWLQLPQEERPHLILLYFHDTDDHGHREGPMSPENKMAIKKLDKVIDDLRKKITDLTIKDDIHLILVSDHGMRQVSEDRLINIEEIIDPKSVRIVGNGPIMNIHLKEKNEINRIYDLLQNKAKNYQAFKRNEIPEKWHYRNSPRIGDLIIVAEPGWSLITNRNLKNIRKYGMAGNHGWDNYDPQMHGIFYGVGPDFKKGYKTGTLRNIDIYPLIANILDISEPAKVDGQLDSIKHIIINNN